MIILDILIVTLSMITGLLVWAGKPTPGGVNTNVVLLLPAILFGILDLILIAIRLLA